MLIETCFYTPVGAIKVVHDEHFLYLADFTQSEHTQTFHLDIQQQIASQLASYHKDSRFRFDLPFKLQGSSFQRKVWNALTVIPSGQTKTYGQLAKSLNTSPRAVGQACKSNPLPLFIPCHRIISQAGLGGYKGKTDDVTIKHALLNHEKACLEPAYC